MNELVKFEKPKLPVIWNYETSVKFVSQTMFKWKSLTEEVAQELYNARVMLSVSNRPKISGTKVPLKTWSEYCEEIGSSKQVVNRWLKQWFPEDIALSKEIKPDWFSENTGSDIEAFTLRSITKIQHNIEKEFGFVFLNEFMEAVYKLFELGVNHTNYKETWKQE